jgi:hypothetical protein
MRRIGSFVRQWRVRTVAVVTFAFTALTSEALAMVSVSPNPPVVDQQATLTQTGTVTHAAATDPNGAGQYSFSERVGPADHPCTNAEALGGTSPVFDLTHPILTFNPFSADGPYSFTETVVFPVAGRTRICEDLYSIEGGNQVITTTEALDLNVREAPAEPVVVPPNGDLPLTEQAPSAGTFTATATYTVGGRGKGKTRAGAAIATLPYGTATATATAPGPVTLTIPPTPAALRALRHKRQLSVTVHLAFRSSAKLGSTTSTKDLKLRVKRRKH